ncbi:MAG: aromatic amino acid lyase, partial [Nesterenkonia sp.]
MTPITLDPDRLSLADVVAVARHSAPVTITEDTLERVSRFRESVERLAEAERPVYGVSTGFGALAQRHIPDSLRTQLQKSLIRSHAAGMGEPVEREVVRAMMLLRARTMATGRTGVRPVVLSTYVE